MIDPRALQQHFRKVHQQTQPKKQDIPRIQETVPLTAFQAINMPAEQKSSDIVTEQIQEQVKESVNLIINMPAPIDCIFIDDIEEEIEQTSVVEVKEKIEDDYDPYGYYSGPRF